jgi:hypothetical protein
MSPALSHFGETAMNNASKLAALALAATLTAGSGLSLAQPAGSAGPARPDSATNFAQHKQMELSRIAARLQALQTLQACVQSAPDHAAMHSCNEAARPAMGHGRS